MVSEPKKSLRPRATAAHTLPGEVSEPQRETTAPTKPAPAKAEPNLIKTRLWHRRLAHSGIEALRKTVSMVDGIDTKTGELAEQLCGVYNLTKSPGAYGDLAGFLDILCSCEPIGVSDDMVIGARIP